MWNINRISGIFRYESLPRYTVCSVLRSIPRYVSELLVTTVVCSLWLRSITKVQILLWYYMVYLQNRYPNLLFTKYQHHQLNKQNLYSVVWKSNKIILFSNSILWLNMWLNTYICVVTYYSVSVSRIYIICIIFFLLMFYVQIIKTVVVAFRRPQFRSTTRQQRRIL